MIKEGINRILDLAPVALHEIDGRKYSDRELVGIHEPMPNALEVHTLSAVADYLRKPDADGLFIHVFSPDVVSVYGPLQAMFAQRPCYLVSKAIVSSFPWGQWQDAENFIIQLQTKFVPTGQRDELLAFVGNIKQEEGIQQEDDGVTQRVTIKTGIAKVAERPAPNPIQLKPYRTFPEIDQPESLYVLRLQGSGQSIRCALFDASGEGWRNQAIAEIALYFKAQADGVRILA